MKLRIFSIAGSALNFGGRRFETIMGVAFLPIVLLLVAEMAAVFAYLSVATGRFISFADVATFLEAKSALAQLWMLAWAAKPEQMAIIFGASLAFQALLVSSFMAPLIRYAGLGEKPRPGVLRIAFGPDQIRFLIGMALSFLITPLLLFAPIAAVAHYVLQYIGQALNATSGARFPDPESLHTIEVLAFGDMLQEQGRLWVYTLAIPVAAAAPFALLSWAVLTAHFRPDDGSRGVGILRRALGALIGGGGFVALIWLWLLDARNTPIASGPSYYFAIAALVIAILVYGNLRMTPYPGIAVCRRSLAPGPALKVTRRWNLLRLAGAILCILFITNMVLVIVNIAFGLIQATVVALYAATKTATELANRGETGSWVYPAFMWGWNGFKILVNILWALFTYGVFAGFLGRLYRDSEPK